MLEKQEKDRHDINIVDDKLNNRVIPIPKDEFSSCSCDSDETCSCKFPRLTIMISILFLTRLIVELTAAILSKEQ